MDYSDMVQYNLPEINKPPLPKTIFLEKDVLNESDSKKWNFPVNQKLYNRVS